MIAVLVSLSLVMLCGVIADEHDPQSDPQSDGGPQSFPESYHSAVFVRTIFTDAGSGPGGAGERYVYSIKDPKLAAKHPGFKMVSAERYVDETRLNAILSSLSLYSNPNQISSRFSSISAQLQPGEILDAGSSSTNDIKSHRYLGARLVDSGQQGVSESMSVRPVIIGLSDTGSVIEQSWQTNDGTWVHRREGSLFGGDRFYVDDPDARNGRRLLTQKNDGSLIAELRAQYDEEISASIVDAERQRRAEADALYLAHTHLRNDAGQALFIIDEAATAAQGWSGYSNLFMSKQQINAWQETRDETFARLYLGTQHWASALCRGQLDVPNKQVAFYESPSTGRTRITASVNGQRLSVVDNGISQTYLYRFELYAVNPRDDYVDPRREGQVDEMCVQAYLEPGHIPLFINQSLLESALQDPELFGLLEQGGSSLAAFAQPHCLRGGQVLSLAGTSSIAVYSDAVYERLCLEFTNAPRLISGSSPLCNLIVQSDTQPTRLPDPTVIGGSTGGSGPQGSVGPGVNIFI